MEPIYSRSCDTITGLADVRIDTDIPALIRPAVGVQKRPRVPLCEKLGLLHRCAHVSHQRTTFNDDNDSGSDGDSNSNIEDDGHKLLCCPKPHQPSHDNHTLLHREIFKVPAVPSYNSLPRLTRLPLLPTGCVTAPTDELTKYAKGFWILSQVLDRLKAEKAREARKAMTEAGIFALQYE